MKPKAATKNVTISSYTTNLMTNRATLGGTNVNTGSVSTKNSNNNNPMEFK